MVEGFKACAEKGGPCFTPSLNAASLGAREIAQALKKGVFGMVI